MDTIFMNSESRETRLKTRKIDYYLIFQRK